MDGEVTIELVKLDEPAVPAGKDGSVAHRRRAGRPADGPHRAAAAATWRCCRPTPRTASSAERPSVILLQTILGDDTVERWAEICLS